MRIKLPHISRIGLAGVSCLVLAACGTPNYTRVLNQRQVPLGYLHRPAGKRCAVDQPLVSVRVGPNPLGVLSTSKVTSTKVVPALIYNSRSVRTNCVLGQKTLEQPYDAFFRDEFLEESKRNGCFLAAADTTSALVLDLAFKECATTADTEYKAEFWYLYVVVMWGHSARRHPPVTRLVVQATLQLDGRILAEKQYALEQEQPLKVKWFARDYPYEVRTDMVESLSQTTKKCVEQIVDDLNETLGK